LPRSSDPKWMRPPRLAPAMRCAALVVLVCAFAETAIAGCIAPGSWALPGETAPVHVAPNRLFADLARRSVILLGEVHDHPDHHRWQLQTIAGLYALHPKLVLGFEMFPRRVQKALDQWVAGELSEDELLKRTEWRTVWGHDAKLYLPIFNFARMNRVPMIALNIDRKLTREVGEKGWAQMPPEEREGITDPAPATPAYLDILYQSFLQHTVSGRKPPASEGRDDPAFHRFVDSMLLWDRAMAQRIAEREKQNDSELMIALMGSGHLQDGHGTPRQLADLGISDAAVLLPFDASLACDQITPQLATALFGISSEDRDEQDERPRLGIMLDQAQGGVRVQKVIDNSIAQQAGLQPDDVIEIIAGEAVYDAADVIATVERQAPGTWLPIVVRRGTQTIEIVARFPPRAQK
jgi:uncharacterized iron-regulated protein